MTYNSEGCCSECYDKGYDDALSEVFVVMANDYPNCVFADKDEADKFVNANNEEQKAEEKRKHGLHRRIFWRVYKFKVKQAA